MARPMDNAASRRLRLVRKSTQRRHENAPKPLPEKWKTRPLLQTLDASNKDQQMQCSLFTLPSEVRLMIYEYVFEAGGAIHILQLKQRLAYLRFTEKEPKPVQFLPRWQARLDIWRPHYNQRIRGLYRSGYGRDDAAEVDQVPEIWHGQRNLLGLPKTCRRLAGETLPVLYGTTEFDFTSVLNVDYFFDTVPRFNTKFITTLTVYCRIDGDLYGGSPHDVDFMLTNGEMWERVWDAIAALPALKQLTVFIDGFQTGVYPNREREQRIAAPLRKITGPKTFWLADLLVDFDDPNPLGQAMPPEIEDGPFRLLKLQSSSVSRDAPAAWKLCPANGNWSVDEYPGVREFV